LFFELQTSLKIGFQFFQLWIKEKNNGGARENSGRLKKTMLSY
jgi:hypothetical protein